MNLAAFLCRGGLVKTITGSGAFGSRERFVNAISTRLHLHLAIPEAPYKYNAGT